jgi:hypothetical protein
MSNLNASLRKCRFSIDKIKTDGAVVECGEHTNLVLDQGLTRLLSGLSLDTFHLGVGSTTVERTQTALVTPIPGSYARFAVTSSSTSTGTDDDGEYIEWVGVGTSGSFTENQNVAEIGFGYSTDGGSLGSRALTRNSSGVPTAISVLTGEVMVVTYYFRVYLPVPGTTGSFNVTTNGTPVSHTWEVTAHPTQTLSIGNSTSLYFTNIASGLLVGGSSVVFTLGTPAVNAEGARVNVSCQRNPSSSLNVSTLISAAATARTIPVRLVISPSVTLTVDQRMNWGYGLGLTQDYP